MRWKKVEGQGDIEDRRGQGGGGMGGLGGGGGLPLPPMKAGGGIGVLIVLAVMLFLGKGVLGGGGGANSGLVPDVDATDATSTLPGNVDAFEFVKYVSKDAQDYWETAITGSGRTYERAPVVIFTSGTQTGCGTASSATGPFYCPADGKVYLDLSFFNELSKRFGAPGDFAAAYVVAHELGHHVQDVLGIEEQMRKLQQNDPQNANEYSVKLELQADCLAGVWGHSVAGRGDLDPGDVDEGLQAAAAVGDDRLGARSREQWTHGSSELRVTWFKKGFESGNPNDCDTFSADI